MVPYSSTESKNTSSYQSNIEGFSALGFPDLLSLQLRVLDITAIYFTAFQRSNLP